MRLYTAKFKANHPNAYQPKGCSTGTIDKILWDAESQRYSLKLRYRNGAIDFIPLAEFTESMSYLFNNKEK
jgi:hypothetical protein